MDIIAPLADRAPPIFEDRFAVGLGDRTALRIPTLVSMDAPASCISAEYAAALGLRPEGERFFEWFQGAYLRYYEAAIWFTDTAGHSWRAVVLLVKLPHPVSGADLVIGRDLARCFVYDATDGRLTLRL